MRLPTLTLLMVLGLATCTKSPAPKAQPGTLSPVELPPEHPAVTPLPDPELNAGHTGRAPRRLTAAQLKQSIQITTGRQWSQLDALAPSLGQADFAVTSIESIEANLVFAKFLDDGAREVCLNAARDDLARTDPVTRVLWPEVPGVGRDFTTLDDATVQANLRTLALRFWGSTFEPDELAAWARTFTQLAARAKVVNKPELAWGGICIALMTDPRFFTY
jgi:hypothetical protein